MLVLFFLPGQEFYVDMLDKIPVVAQLYPIPTEGVGPTQCMEHQLVCDQKYTEDMEELVSLCETYNH